VNAQPCSQLAVHRGWLLTKLCDCVLQNEVERLLIKVRVLRTDGGVWQSLCPTGEPWVRVQSLGESVESRGRQGLLRCSIVPRTRCVVLHYRTICGQCHGFSLQNSVVISRWNAWERRSHC